MHCPPDLTVHTCAQVPSISEAGGPSQGLQLAVGLLGLLAVPVVAYSLYTLAYTGA